MSTMTLGDLNPNHVGRPVYGVDGVAGWEPYLLLQSVEHNDGMTRVMFRWNDDPDPSNTERGKFAIGVVRPSTQPCSLTPPAKEVT